jgi:hypothetical protein
MTSEKLRQILCAAGLVGYLSWTTAPTAAAATEGSSKTYDWCYASCGAEESCATECENDGRVLPLTVRRTTAASAATPVKIPATR